MALALGVPVREVALALGSLLGTVFGEFWRVWRVWKVLECLERLRAGKRPWPWGACWGRCLEGLEGFGGFGGFGKFWNVWSVCGLANGSFESL